MRYIDLWFMFSTNHRPQNCTFLGVQSYFMFCVFSLYTTIFSNVRMYRKFSKREFNIVVCVGNFNCRRGHKVIYI